MRSLSLDRTSYFMQQWPAMSRAQSCIIQDMILSVLQENNISGMLCRKKYRNVHKISEV